MVKVCKRHTDNPVKIYHQCVGCELEWLREELEQKQQEIDRLKKQDIDVIFSYAVERKKLIEGLLTIMYIASVDRVHRKLDKCYTTARDVLKEVGALSR